MSTAYPPVGLRVTQAYVRLFFVPESEDGARTISLARFGNYEVRLVELVQSDGACDPPLWVELYDRNIPGSIDSCSASDLEEMVCAAEQLLSEAKQLREGAEQGDMSGKVEQHRSNDSIRRTRCNSFKSHVCLLGAVIDVAQPRRVAAEREFSGASLARRGHARWHPIDLLRGSLKL